MIINDVLQGLPSRDQPLAKVLHKGDHTRALVIGFTKNMLLKEHQAHLPSTLVVIKGSIVYKQGGVDITLRLYDQIEIPVAVLHSVEALEDSLCLLVQG
jgi:quercetin dioxygenase-like cupin family protein